MKNILSIQSHVAYGYVGNRAAVFPLQRLGHEVMVLNTVQFSNHTGYGQWSGEIFSPAHIHSLIQGLKPHAAFQQLDAVLSGYLGEAALGELILTTVAERKQEGAPLTYCCDPVLGDVGRGIFVRPGVAEFFKERAVAAADILTPNQFELAYLVGDEVTAPTTALDTPSLRTLPDILAATAALRARGPHTVLVTSVEHEDSPLETISMLIDTQEGSWCVTTPRLFLDPAPNGSGDATAALFLAHYLESRDPIVALRETAAAIYAIFKITFEANTRELQLIRAQDQMVHPPQYFDVVRIR